MSLARVVSIGGILVCASLAAGAQAPAADQPQWMLISFAKTYPGMGPQYVDLQVKEVMPAQMKAGGPGRQAYSSGVSGPAGEFVYLSPITSWAQFDGPAPLVRALGQAAAAALNAKVAKLAEPMGSAIARTRPDLSYVPDPKAGPAPLAIVTIVDLVHGKRAEFEAIVKNDVVSAMKAAKVHSYHVLEVMYGEHSGGYITAIGYDKYESIGKGHPFTTALGEEGARKLEAKTGGVITKLHRFIARHRPELSWTPKAGS